ncbi:MAG: hypothetical protein QOK01_1599, partial [Alphaproteobacteria bacterium]|nr:hypothetical protein [Alphaproteobacteria bacterium]
RFIIPDELTIAALALGFAHAALLDTDAIMQSLATAALRGTIESVPSNFKPPPKLQVR